MNRKTFLLGLALFSGGCATVPSQKAARIVAVKSPLPDCQLLGAVTGTSMIGGVAPTLGLSNSRADALEDAAKLGATHVSWQSTPRAPLGTIATGLAFRCVQGPRKTKPREEPAASSPAPLPTGTIERYSPW